MAKPEIKRAKSVGSGSLSADIKIDLSRLDRNLKKAQYRLDGAVMQHMTARMPMQTGTFINVTMAKSAAVQGTGKVYAAAGPSGRFLYHGKGMVGTMSGSPYAKKGEEKVLVSEYGGVTNAKENLDLTKSNNPNAVPHWFETTKEEFLDNWVDIVGKTMKEK